MARFLIVDDSPFILGILEKSIVGQGHEIVAKGLDGIEGVALYKEHKPDLVLLDLTMPNKDGQSCLQEILAFDDGANIIMVTAVENRSTIVSCINLGAKGYIEKPIQLRDAEYAKRFWTMINEALPSSWASNSCMPTGCHKYIGSGLAR